MENPGELLPDDERQKYRGEASCLQSRCRPRHGCRRRRGAHSTPLLGASASTGVLRAIGIGVVCTSPGSGGVDKGTTGSGTGTFGSVAIMVLSYRAQHQADRAGWAAPRARTAWAAREYLVTAISGQVRLQGQFRLFMACAFLGCPWRRWAFLPGRLLEGRRDMRRLSRLGAGRLVGRILADRPAAAGLWGWAGIGHAHKLPSISGRWSLLATVAAAARQASTMATKAA